MPKDVTPAATELPRTDELDAGGPLPARPLVDAEEIGPASAVRGTEKEGERAHPDHSHPARAVPTSRGASRAQPPAGIPDSTASTEPAHLADDGRALAATVLVVDAANVVGSVPDGWWRDRAGAAQRLHAHLVAEALPYDWIVVVLEGKARAGVPEGSEGHTRAPDQAEGDRASREVQTVHAEGSGDDELVAQCQALTDQGAQVSLATADRGLMARVPDTVRIVGPRSVRHQPSAAHSREGGRRTNRP